MNTIFRKILSTTALCLAAMGFSVFGCAPDHENVNNQIGGAEIPAGWDFSTKKRWKVRHEFPNGGRLTKHVIDFSELPEFSPYCGKEVQFLSPLAIQRTDYEAGTSYELQDNKPQPEGVSDLYHVPVHTGKLMAVRCLWDEYLKPGAKAFNLETISVEALLEIQHPHVQVNNGKPLYLTYVLADHKTPPHRIRAPWKASTATESPHSLELLMEAVRSTPEVEGALENLQVSQHDE